MPCCTPSAFAIGLGLVVLLALAVRLPGLNSDVGHVPIDIDENRLAGNVQHYFATGELRHDTVEHYPGAVFWLFAAGSFAGYLRGLTGGLVVGPSQLPVELFVRSARLVNVGVGAAIVMFTGLVGRRLFGSRAGLAAAFVVAVVPLSIETTTLVRNDPGMVLVVTAAVYFAIVALDDPRRDRWVVASGALAGVATGIKYSSVFAVLPAVVAALAGGTPWRAVAPRWTGAGRIRGRGGDHESFRVGGLPELSQAAGRPGRDHRPRPLGRQRQPGRLLRRRARSLRSRLAAAGAGGRLRRLRPLRRTRALPGVSRLPALLPLVHDEAAVAVPAVGLSNGAVRGHCRRRRARARSSGYRGWR